MLMEEYFFRWMKCIHYKCKVFGVKIMCSFLHIIDSHITYFIKIYISFLLLTIVICPIILELPCQQYHD